MPQPAAPPTPNTRSSLPLKREEVPARARPRPDVTVQDQASSPDSPELRPDFAVTGRAQGQLATSLQYQDTIDMVRISQDQWCSPETRAGPGGPDGQTAGRCPVTTSETLLQYVRGRPTEDQGPLGCGDCASLGARDRPWWTALGGSRATGPPDGRPAGCQPGDGGRGVSHVGCSRISDGRWSPRDSGDRPIAGTSCLARPPHPGGGAQPRAEQPRP